MLTYPRLHQDRIRLHLLRTTIGDVRPHWFAPWYIAIRAGLAVYGTFALGEACGPLLLRLIDMIGRG